jgi:membrane-associated phospholipid phosphatase
MIKYVQLIFILVLATNLMAQNMDIVFLRKINVDRNTKLDQAFIVITNSDSPVSLAVPSGFLIAGLIKKDSTLINKGLYIGGSLVVSSIITTGLKYSIKRDRPFVTYPDIVKLSPAGSPSFPSGHTSMAFSTATSLSLAVPKWYVIVPAHLWAGAVGYSRMHLGVHYPSDVFFGALIGSGSAVGCFYLNNWLKEKRNKKREDGLKL